MSLGRVSNIFISDLQMANSSKTSLTFRNRTAFRNATANKQACKNGNYPPNAAVNILSLIGWLFCRVERVCTMLASRSPTAINERCTARGPWSVATNRPGRLSCSAQLPLMDETQIDSVPAARCAVPSTSNI